MRIEPFRMERMQSRFENTVEYNLSESGVHPMTCRELLEGAPGDPARLLDLGLGYPQTNGTAGLRERIATLYDGATRDNVLVANGGSEANYATLWSLLEKNDRVAYMLPNYLQTWGLARAYAGRTDPFRLVPRRDGAGTWRWALDVDGLARAVGRRTRVILVTNPNNPTGAVLSQEEMDEVVRAARRVGAFIVADEIYRGAEFDGPPTPSFWGRYDRVLVTSGLSKAFGLPGLRIGWVVGAASMVERIWSYRDYTTIAPGVLSDHLARVALEPTRRRAILERTRAILNRNLPVVEDWIGSHPSIFTYARPQAGAIVYMKYRLPIASAALVEKLRLERSVLIVPGAQFGMGRYLRIGFGSDADYLRRGLERIDRTLDELQGGPPSRKAAPGRNRAAATGRARPPVRTAG